MTWKCRLLVYDKQLTRDTWNIGDMFYGPAKDEMRLEGNYSMWVYMQARFLSEYYWAHNSERRPLFVVLPNNDLFCIDGQCWSNGTHYGGWTVSGEAPNITVSPSINIGGSYHGFLQDGVISDDVEGRSYDATGALIRT